MNSNATLGMLSAISDFLVCINAQGIIQSASEPSRDFLQATTGLLQESFEAFVQPEDIPFFSEAQRNAKQNGEKQAFVCRLLRQGVLPVWVDCYIYYLPEDKYLIAAFDATHWKASENRLIHLATHDALTGLPGKVLLDDRITMNIQIARREKNYLSLVILSLDGYRKINDLLGQSTGDELIKAVAERLQICVRRSDTVARVGESKFAMIMAGVGQDHTELIARKIMTAMQRSFRIQEHTFHISANLGISIYPEHGESSLQLFRNAEMAMYQARAQGKNHWKL